MSSEIVIFYLEEQDRFLYYIFDGKLNLLEDFDSKKYEDFKKNLYLISDKFNSFKINLPDTSKRNISKAAPVLLEEKLLDNVNSFVWNLNKNGKNIVCISKHNLESFISKFEHLNLSSLKSFENIEITNPSVFIFGESVILTISEDYNFNTKIHQLENFLIDIQNKENLDTIDCYLNENSKFDVSKFEILNPKIFKKESDIFSDLNINWATATNNFLVNEYQPKILWSKIFNKFSFYFYSATAVISVFIFSNLIQVFSLIISNSYLEEELLASFKQKFPNQEIKSDLIRQVNSLINIESTSADQLRKIGIISESITLSEDINLVSIKFDRDNFNLEVETSSYAEIENLINLISSMGVESRAGASRRLNNKILGEINVQQF